MFKLIAVTPFQERSWAKFTHFGIFGQDTGLLYTESAYISYLNNGVQANRSEE